MISQKIDEWYAFITKLALVLSYNTCDLVGRVFNGVIW